MEIATSKAVMRPRNAFDAVVKIVDIVSTLNTKEQVTGSDSDNSRFIALLNAFHTKVANIH